MKINRNDHSVYNTAARHRVAFVSIHGLYNSFRRIPTHILWGSMFMLKIKREWLYNPLQSINDNDNIIHKQGMDKDHDFLMCLKWKDSQGYLKCMMDYHDNNNNNHNNNNNNNNHMDNNNNNNNNEQDIVLPTDLGIESSDDDDQNEEDEDDDDEEFKLDDINMNINNENAFEFAANIPLSSPTHSIGSMDLQCINEIISNHTPNYDNNNFENGFDFNINMHEININNLPNRLSLSTSKSNGPNLPLTPSASEDRHNFAPPLPLRRNETNMVNVSDYNVPQNDLRICQTIQEETEPLETKFDFLDDDDDEEDNDEMLSFDIDDEEFEDDDDDDDEPQCAQKPNLRLTLSNDNINDHQDEEKTKSPGFEPITPADFGGNDDDEEDDDDNFVVHRGWVALSQDLSKTYDPFNGENYAELILDKNWWINHFKQSQYGTTSKEILEELTQCNMSFRCVMEILYQSNPSLIPCQTYRLRVKLK